MIVDTSAVVAILTQEADGRRCAEAIGRAEQPRMAAPTYVEVGLVLDRRPDVPAGALDAFLERAQVVIETFTAEHARVARRAHGTFGGGTGSRARLNLGDCFAYALAITEGEPLLFKGADFTHTDVRNAMAELSP